MKIRRATVADRDALVSLNRETQALHAEAHPDVFREDAPDAEVSEAFRRMMEKAESCWLAAEESGLIVGYLSAEFLRREASWCAAARSVCYLASVVVAPSSRRTGVAQALVEALKRECAARAVMQVELDVWAFNVEARQAFERLGFVPVRQRMRAAVKQPTERAGTCGT